MRIGIDISQIAHQGTGVAEYTKNLVENLLKIDQENEYVLFYSSLRKPYKSQKLKFKSQKYNAKVKSFRIPPTLLDLFWNKLHILPIEWFIGDVDVFLSSDWVQPPANKAKMITVIYDLIALKFPKETHPKTEFNLKNTLITPNIAMTQKRRLNWVAKECDMIICDSQATENDVIELLNIDKKRLKVIYPGL